MAIHVSHFPPGTSKWNKVAHRLFSFISINWRGRPLRTYETVISLIGNTTNRGGLVQICSKNADCASGRCRPAATGYGTCAAGFPRDAGRG